MAAAVVSTSRSGRSERADDDVGQPAEQREHDRADEQLQRAPAGGRCPSTSSSEMPRTTSTGCPVAVSTASERTTTRQSAPPTRAGTVNGLPCLALGDLLPA